MAEQQQKQSRQNQKQRGSAPKMRGSDRDAPDVRISKSLSWLLRHGAKTAGLQLRPDGYANVSDVLANPIFKDITFGKLQEVVSKDAKQRYSLVLEPQIAQASSATNTWWIRANQGHSIKDVRLELKPILSASEIPMAVHGTTRKAWELICECQAGVIPSPLTCRIATQGLSKMNRNHIHLARGLARDSVISGMRSSSQILIFIDVQKALDAGIPFFLSDNGVVLTAGDESGFLLPTFFRRVENANRTPVPGWESRTSDIAPPPEATVTTVADPLESSTIVGVEELSIEEPPVVAGESHS
ncbi:hypothetical protein BV22DRAFT_1013613 [Leucogyrophana mollusca]|uniref:Uncharacterized protein n=1 Tax=Leucogyrophana mollusca TaxID=85980 RepID=A0ACB8BGA9_9AGAM|nr:hypothetical protein BV22DRAFT_1013613 [Leucogyrophana mollusca]